MANEFANQYGINLGAIDNAISQKKTAEANLAYRNLQNNALQRQDTKEVAADKAEQDYMQNPQTAVAATIAQKIQWNNLNASERADKTAAIKEQINQKGIAINNIMGIQDPEQQKVALQQTVAKMSPDEQAQFSQKYGANPDEWQQNLPHVMNDLIVADGGVKLLEDQAKAKTQHGYKIEEIQTKEDAEAKQRTNQNAFAAGQGNLNRQNAMDIANIRTDSNDASREVANAIRQQSVDTAKQRASDELSAKQEQQKQTRIKNVERYVADVPNFDSLSSEDQATAKQIYIETGKVPDITSEEGSVSKLTGGKISLGKNYKLKGSTTNNTNMSNTTSRPPLSQF